MADQKGFEDRRQKIIEMAKESGLIPYMGIKLGITEPGKCCGELTLTENHLNAMGIVHGGTSFSLADTVAGIAAVSCGRVVTTLSGTFNYLRAGKNCAKLKCKAFVITADENIMVCDAVVVNEQEDILCKGLFQYAVIGNWEDE